MSDNALASRTVDVESLRRDQVWIGAAAVALAVGICLRLVVLGTGGIGDRSATVMAALLGLAVWAAAMLLGTSRTAFLCVLGLMLLVDLAALPARNAPGYDDREAFFRTDQVIGAQVSTPAAPTLVLTALVEPVFGGSQPAFGLAGEVGSASLSWDCPFQHGLQWLALPVPPAATAGSRSVDVRLRLTGAPSREADYLLVYASSVRGGLLVSMVGAADVPLAATNCALR